MTTRPADEDASSSNADVILRAYKIIHAARTGGETVVDGVTLSFGSDLDPDEWHLLNAPGLHGTGSEWQPEIIFSWTPPKWRRHLEAKSAKLILAEPGSSVLLLGGADSPIDMGFADLDDPANTERKLRAVAVRHADGTVEVAHRPLQFLRVAAVASLVSAGDYYGAFRGMLTRVGATLEVPVDDLEEIADGGQLDVSSDVLASMSFSMREAVVALMESYRDRDGHAMAAFGYMIGRAEAEAQLLAPARAGVKSLKNVQKASLARQANARAASEPVRQQARAIIASFPDISPSACAREIAKTRSEDQSWIHRTIKELFIERENGRGYRPRRADELPGND